MKKSDEKNLIRRINSALPEDIIFLAYSKVNEDFTARHLAKYREYHYYFFSENYDIELMKEMAKKFVGEHDFRNFCKMKPEYERFGYKRTIMKCEIVPCEKYLTKFLPMHKFVC